MDGIDKGPVVAAGQVGPADRPEKDHVADDRDGLFGGDEDDVPGCVAWCEHNLEPGSAEGERLARHQLQVRRRLFLERHAEGRRLGPDVVVVDALRGVKMDRRVAGPLSHRHSLDVVEVSVRQQDRDNLEPAFPCGGKRIRRRGPGIDQDGGVPIGADHENSVLHEGAAGEGEDLDRRPGAARR